MNQNQKTSYKAKIAKYGAMIAAAPVALMAFASTTFAASGLTLGSDSVTGAKTGLTEAAESISSTVNNQYLWTLAIMFIGFSFVVGLIAYLVKGHRKI